MKISLDRRFCTRWQGSCEACFATRMVQGNFDAADCGLSMVDDGEDVMKFDIRDRDGSLKHLTITPENWGQAYDSWLQLWKEQVGAA